MTAKIWIAAAASVMSLATAPLPASAETSVRITPGQVCAQNRCVRFSNDLQSVSIQARRSVSVAQYNLDQQGVIPFSTFREIYFTALRQGPRYPTR